MNKKEFKNYAKKTWHFIWEDDSWQSWVVNIVLAFLLIKFIVYPGLGFAFQTHYPVVAVVSGSMEHKAPSLCQDYDISGKCLLYDPTYGEICGKKSEKIYFMGFDRYWDTCGDWYTKNTAIKKEEFQDFSFKNGFNTGDIMVLYGTKPENVKVGDVIVFSTSARPDPIIHRVIKVWNDENNQLFFQTKGDHNGAINSVVNEGKISKDRYIGRAVIRIPYLGWIKIGFVNFINWGRNLFL